MALMCSFRDRLPEPLTPSDHALFAQYSTQFLLSEYAKLSGANRPPLGAYLLRARRRGLLELARMRRAEWLPVLRAAGFGAVLDFGLRVKRRLRARR